MRAGGAAAVAHAPHRLAPRHPVALADLKGAEMGVEGADPAAVVDLDRAAIAAPPAGEVHHPRRGRAHRRPQRRPQVDPLVDGPPPCQRVPAAPEMAGDDEVVQRRAQRQRRQGAAQAAAPAPAQRLQGRGLHILLGENGRQVGDERPALVLPEAPHDQVGMVRQQVPDGKRRGRGRRRNRHRHWTPVGTAGGDGAAGNAGAGHQKAQECGGRQACGPAAVRHVTRAHWLPLHAKEVGKPRSWRNFP